MMNEENNEIFFPFYLSYQAENYALMRFFLKTDKRQPREFNCFSDACKRGNVVMMQFLSDHGAKIFNNVKEPPLVKTVSNNKVNATKWLIKNGCDVMWKDQNGRNLLFFAIRFNSLEVLRFLIKQGHDVNQTSNDGTTPLMEASSFGNQTIINLLLRHGADPCCKDKYGETALQIAYSEGRMDIADILSKYSNKEKQINNYQKLPRNTPKRTNKTKPQQQCIYEEEEDSEDSSYEIDTDKEKDIEELCYEKKSDEIRLETSDNKSVEKKKMSKCCRI